MFIHGSVNTCHAAFSQIHFDKSQRFTKSDRPSLSYQWDFDSHIQLSLLLSGNAGEISVIPIVVLEDPEDQFADPSTSVYVKSGTDYYTRYAYTACDDCNTHDKQNWSHWSPTLGFKCPAE